VMRKDFEGVEIDVNYGQITQSGKISQRAGILLGRNFFDDRLNVYAFAEVEDIEGIGGPDLDWLADGRTVLAVDADPTSPANGPNSDGIIDLALFYNARLIGRAPWGITTLANAQRPSALNNPLVPVGSCTSLISANCYSVDPAKTYVYEGGAPRLANFGQRIGDVGLNRPYNIGGDGTNGNTEFTSNSRVPENLSERFQVGTNFEITPNVTASLEAKYVTEESYMVTQYTFFDTFIADINGTNPATGQVVNANTAQGNTGNQYFTRLDNAFLPASLRAAIVANQVATWSAPTLTSPGNQTATTNRQWARHLAWGPARTQTNNRELQRYVAALHGSYDRVGFINNLDWDLSYTYGEVQNVNLETGMDKSRLQHSLDSIVDTAGEVNGRPGEVVCRVKLLAARGQTIRNYNPLDPRTNLSPTDPEIAQCVPLNIFGAGNQSPEGLAYIDAAITVRELNEQEDATFSVAGQLWDFWGAGPIGVAVGAEYRREYTEGIGRSRDTAGRNLQLNTGDDFLGAGYETVEYFGELSLPLMRDTWLGEYAELSGSYRAFDYTTAGEGDVYGVNLIYRPIQDITFKTSFNTSFRAPNLSENFRPRTQTFANGFSDPCDTRQITSANRTAAERANRIANCTALAAERGLTYDFAGTTSTNTDDYLPTYSSGIAGVNGGNPFLKPEESESFTFSTVIRPRFFPDVTVVLDYYEIEITDVIASVSAQVLANQCVDGPTLNAAACAVIFRSNPTTGDPFDVFKVGAPGGDPVGGFIQGSFNYAKRKTRGLDFKANYRLDLAEAFGREWGRLSYSVSGSWLLDQQSFDNAIDLTAFTENASNVFFPRVRLTSRLTWAPIDAFSMTWTTDWQTSQDISNYRDVVAGGNVDSRPFEWFKTGNFARNDLSFRWAVRDNLDLRGGVTNIFDAEQAPWLGNTLYSNFDPNGRRFNIGLNYRPW
jgi:outer membrane receptor protein involved in Fe transport